MFLCITRKTLKRAGYTLAFFGLMATAIGISVIKSEAKAEEAAQPLAQTVAKHEWGLFFEKSNTPPIPNLEAEDIAPYNAFYISPRPEKKLYLTFDAGYENGNTPAILDALAKHKAPAAFFVVYPYIKENPELINRMVSEGHIVGNHTHHHPNMSNKGKAEFEQELRDVESIYTEITGHTMLPYYRPPEGKFSNENLVWAKEMGYRTIFWSNAYRDWNVDAQPNSEDAIKKVLSRTHDGAIVLLHSTSKTNADIMDTLLTKWEEQGYTFAPLTDFEEFCS